MFQGHIAGIYVAVHEKIKVENKDSPNSPTEETTPGKDCFI